MSHNLSSFLSSRCDDVAAWRSWTKSTHASVRPRPSVSQSSVSLHTADTMELLSIIPMESNMESNLTYPLSRVIGSHASADNDKHHENSCHQLARWIITKAANLPSNSEEIRIGTSLHSPLRDDPLWISSCKLPDVAWWYEEEVIVQIEVVSNYNAEKTVNKLCLGLVDQLRSWKNRLSTVSSVAGFLFPISNNQRNDVECGQCVHKVELTWNVGNVSIK